MRPPDGEAARLLSRAVQRERSVVTGALGQDLDARVVLAVGIGQVAARLTELFLAACPRLAELAIDLGFREAGEMRVTDGMRADLEASVRERAELGPVHRLELVGKSNRVRRELGNVERTALVGKGRRSKDRGRHPQALEQVQAPEMLVYASSKVTCRRRPPCRSPRSHRPAGTRDRAGSAPDARRPPAWSARAWSQPSETAW